MNAIVAAVMMATLVVGPFCLSRALGLNEAWVGLVMSVGPSVSIVSGAPAGWMVDRLGAPLMVAVALVLMAAGALALSTLPASHGVAGYVAAVAILTPGYQLFQAANSTTVMLDILPEERGVTAGLLSLSRNLGLVTGAAVMGALFAYGTGAPNLNAASPEALTAGLRITFTIAAGLLAAAAGVAARRRASRSPLVVRVQTGRGRP
jgi:MFS family permease